MFLLHGLGSEPFQPIVWRVAENGIETWKVDPSLSLEVQFNVEWMLGYARQTRGIWAPIHDVVESEKKDSYKPNVEAVEKQSPKLESTFAHEQLIRIAKNSTKAEFIVLIAPIFGFDIPAKTYIKLYQGLRDGSVKNPEIEIVSGGRHRAAFDSHSHKILVRQDMISRAVHHNERPWALLAMLLRLLVESAVHKNSKSLSTGHNTPSNCCRGLPAPPATVR